MIQKEYQINEKRVIKNFISLAKISSPSWKEAVVIDYLVSFAEKNKINYNKIPCMGSFNLLFKIPGTVKKSKGLLFAAHTDTVLPCANIVPIETPDRIKSSGNSILGSDDKAAIAAFLEAILLLKDYNIQHGDLEFLFTCAEEIGLEGIKHFDINTLSSDYGFVFDCSGQVGTAIIKAPYHSSMRVIITGRPAHAGIEPEKGISAIRAASEIICSLPDGRVDDETTTNVGIISGGQATNIVPAEAVFTLECRSISNLKLKNLEKSIKNIISTIAKKNKVKYKIQYNLEYKGFSIKMKSPIIKLFEKAAYAIGLTPAYTASGGGSDTNVLNANSLSTLNLAIGMTNVHTTKEYILKKDIYDAVKLILSLISND